MRDPLSFLHRFSDFGLLVLRAVTGATFVHYGVQKLAGGASEWERVGTAMEHVGVDFGLRGWGLAAGLTEAIGGALLVLGLFPRSAATALCGVMIVATLSKAAGSDLGRVDRFTDFYYPLTMAAVTFALAFLGAGRLALESPAGGAKSPAAKPAAAKKDKKGGDA